VQGLGGAGQGNSRCLLENASLQRISPGCWRRHCWSRVTWLVRLPSLRESVALTPGGCRSHCSWRSHADDRRGFSTVLWHKQRLIALFMLSGGKVLFVALAFARFSAPDLALTAALSRSW